MWAVRRVWPRGVLSDMWHDMTWRVSVELWLIALLDCALPLLLLLLLMMMMAYEGRLVRSLQLSQLYILRKNTTEKQATCGSATASNVVCTGLHLLIFKFHIFIYFLFLFSIRIIGIWWSHALCFLTNSVENRTL